MAFSGTTMSLNRIAASTPCRRTGCRVISVTRSGRRQDSSMPMPSRTRRYSGSDRPAWRMNHTGVCGTGSPRQARRNALSCRAGESSAGAVARHRRIVSCRRARSAGGDESDPAERSGDPQRLRQPSRSWSTIRASRTVTTG